MPRHRSDPGLDYLYTESTDMSLPRIPAPRRGIHHTVRCAQCGFTGLDEEPACGHRDKWKFITAGMHEWVPYTDHDVREHLNVILNADRMVLDRLAFGEQIPVVVLDEFDPGSGE